MGKIISYVSDSAYVYYSKITNLCTRKKNKKFGNNFCETPNESLLDESHHEESCDDIKINFVVNRDKTKVKTSNSMKNEYQLLKNSEDYDFKRNDRDIENLSKEIKEINIVEDKHAKAVKDGRVESDLLDLDSLEDLKRQIFDKNEIN